MICKSSGLEVQDHDEKGYKSWCVVRIGVVFVGVIVACMVLSNSEPMSYVFIRNSRIMGMNRNTLDIVLKRASMKNKTVILTTLNDAWAEPNSIFDLFLESFRIGNKTKRLVKHLVVICMDKKAYKRCLALHPHCHHLRTKGINFSSEALFMNPDYLQMMWRRIEFLAHLLEKGYSFVFTDSDIMWLQNPFKRFYPDADFQIACDYFWGNSYDVDNLPNGGFNYVKSNNRTIQFYKFWYKSRERYPGLHDQDVLNKIKHEPFIKEIGLQLRFLDTAYFGGFCQPRELINLICTMHANCCVGLQNKVRDLQILLDDWRRFMLLNPTMLSNATLSVPQYCRTSFEHHNTSKENSKTAHKK
ncbi:hypothetical protein FNV43_RR20922 [Rhamnella rubrinervis]|uniref:Glycosyltransferase n=1 Tax=Rhamnella rubrinervis TaxID=2594499 RepID=A0A8K0E0P9_9ROSA|nr:hypothetical protein FNV43_RR20922 [Rhamnella rubrinervis]